MQGVSIVLGTVRQMTPNPMFSQFIECIYRNQSQSGFVLCWQTCLVPENPNGVLKGRLAGLTAYRVPVAILSAKESVVC